MTFFTPEINAIAVTEKLLKHLQVKVTYSTLKRDSEDHPDFPSLLSISDCLTKWGVDNQSYRIEKDKFEEEELQFPFVAHFRENGGSFILVTKMDAEYIYYADELAKDGQMPRAEFLTRFSSFALYAISNENSGEDNYSQKRFKEILQALIVPGFILVILAILYLSFAKKELITWEIPILSLLKITGISLSVLLLIQSINANNPFVKNLCTLGGENDCNAILKSGAANVTSWLSWSEVGFFYFSGSFLFMLLVPSSLLLLAYLNLLALPYILYSVNYQYRHKNWCLLCCGVQVILFLEALVLLSTQNLKFLTFNLQIDIIALAIVSFLTPLLTWASLKPFFSRSVRLQPVKNQLKKFKYNVSLFNQALKNQPRYVVEDGLVPIVLGNLNAKNVITVVSNPFCGPCASAHQIIDNLLDNNEDIKIEIIITSSEYDTDPKKQVAIHMNSLNIENKLVVKVALSDWYKQSEKSYKNWSKKYPTRINEKVHTILANQRLWCSMAEIKVTPTILVNGYKLIEPYHLEDIEYLIQD